LAVREVFEVLYSPVNAFKKIIENPDFKGVVMVLVLVMSSMLVVQYVASSKINVETRLPETDDWTEMIVDQHAWTSSGSLSLDGTDYQMGNDDGNHSIASVVQNETSLWMRVMDFESANCSADTEYIELFFWMNYTNDQGLLPTSGTIKLFSGSVDSYFEYDNIENMFTISGNWTNTTISVGPNQGWSANNSPDWENITGIEITLEWASAAEVTAKIDGLYFRKYVPFIDVAGIGGVIQLAMVNLALPFAIDWIIWSGILIIVGKLFQEELGLWSRFFTIIGYSYIVTFIYTILNIAAILSLPTLNLPADATMAAAAISETWLPLLGYQMSMYLPIVERLWLAGLAAVVIKQIRNTVWGKTLTMVAVAFGIRYLLSLFLF